MQELILGPATKSVPPELWGRSASEVAEERLPVDRFLTPLLVLDRTATRHNVDTLVAWAHERDLEFAPHGKTTMAPALWSDLIDAGASMLTLATPWQAMVAADAGIRSILLADELVDPIAIEWATSRLDEDPDFSLTCFLDSARGLELLAGSLGERPIDVLVELGGPGGRAGVRDADSALALAWGASREPRVRLVGVAGWEGPFGPDRSPESVSAVRSFLAELAGLATTIADNGFFDVDRPIVSAGGSTWFDLVDEELRGLPEAFRRVIRSGAFQAHDSAHYAELSPLRERLRPALRCFARVLSRPSRELAILDAGRRDVPFDMELPVLLDDAGNRVPQAEVTELNDQHAYLRIPAESPLAVGDVVRLGISHPCTAFDKWRAIPVVDGVDVERPIVSGFVETRF